MSASTLLRTSRLAAGLSQTAIAKAAKTSQPAVSDIEGSRRDPSITLLESLLLPTGHRLIAVPTRRSTASDIARDIAQALPVDGPPSALRLLFQLSNDLVDAGGVEAVVLCASEPALIGCPSWDAAIAGIVEYRLGERNLPKPQWLEAPSRFLSQPDDFSEAFGGGTPNLDGVPDALRRRGVYIEDGELQSV